MDDGDCSASHRKCGSIGSDLKQTELCYLKIIYYRPNMLSGPVELAPVVSLSSNLTQLLIDKL